MTTQPNKQPNINTPERKLRYIKNQIRGRLNWAASIVAQMGLALEDAEQIVRLRLQLDNAETALKKANFKERIVNSMTNSDGLPQMDARELYRANLVKKDATALLRKTHGMLTAGKKLSDPSVESKKTATYLEKRSDGYTHEEAIQA